MEVTELVKVLELNYSNSFRGKSKEDMKAFINLYSIQFRNYKASEVNTAIMNIISNDPSPFAPTVAKIKQSIKSHALIETTQSLMKKYDKEYDDQYSYREDEMICLIFYKMKDAQGELFEECKEDFKKVTGQDYDTYMKKIKNILHNYEVFLNE